MRAILDECLPRPLCAELFGHSATTVQQPGWSGTKNGALLRLIDQAGYDAFITMDKNLPNQQVLSRLKFGVVVLHARSNKLVDLSPLAPAVLMALATLRPGRVVRVGA